LGFYGITHATTSFFYAVESNRNSGIVIVGEVVLMVFFAIVLPQFLGLDGVWLTVVATQAVLSVLSLGLLQASKPKIRAQAAAYASHKEGH
jgi:Na+-driven multidrug efflux pump